MDNYKEEYTSKNGVKFVLEPMTQEDFEIFKKIGNYSFTAPNSEPCIRAAGIVDEEFDAFQDFVWEGCKNDGLCVVVKQDGKVVGGSLCENFPYQFFVSINPDEPPKEVEEFCEKYPKFYPIFDILDVVDEKYTKYCEEKKELVKTIHIFVTAIAKKFRGHGLLRTITEVLIKIAKARKYTKLVSESTNYFSIEPRKKMGFVKIAEAEYGSYVYKGNCETYKNKKVFEKCLKFEKPKKDIPYFAHAIELLELKL